MPGKDPHRGDFRLERFERGVMVKEEYVHLRQPIDGLRVAHDDTLLIAERQSLEGFQGVGQAGA